MSYLRDDSDPSIMIKAQDRLNTIFMDQPQCYQQAKPIYEKVGSGQNLTVEEQAFFAAMESGDYSQCSGSSGDGVKTTVDKTGDVASVINTSLIVGGVIVIAALYLIFGD